jgi:hypothetical protein
VRRLSPAALRKEIRDAFSARFDETTDLLEKLSSDSSNATAFVILACSAIDSLANLSSTRGTQAIRFTRFLEKYSGKRDELQKTAVPNLYYYNFRVYVTLEAIIGTPGRIRLFEPAEDRNLARVILDSGLPITAEETSALMEYFSRRVQRRYRTTATQRRSKPVLDSVDSVHQFLLVDARKYKSGRYLDTFKSMKSLIEQFTVGSIIYREYRSGSIHEFDFELDERFFKETGLYVDTVRHPWDPTIFLEVRVSAPWLLDAYRSCIDRYRRRLEATLKLPLPLFLDLCEIPRDLDYLDSDSVDEGLELKPNVGR